MRAHLQDALRLLHRGRQLTGFFVGMHHGFFQVDVFTLVHGVHRHLGVPVIRSGDHHGVHVRLVQQFAIIQVAFHLVALGVDAFALFVHIANRHHLAGIVVLLPELRERLGIV